MAIKSRSNGGGGGGSVAVYNTSCDDPANLVSPQVRKLTFAMEALGIYATIDANDETCVVIGDPPVFEPKVVFSPPPLVQARVSVSDTNEPDTFDDGGWANSVQKATSNSMPWFTSTLGRGFGDNATLRVVIQHSDTTVEDHTFPCNANGGQTHNGVIVVINDYAEDGDGSAYKGRFNINVDFSAYTAYPQSGKFTVGFQFTEHKWGEVVTYSETLFYDRGTTTPVITGTPSVREHDTPSERVIKYLSGIGYYTTGSKFTVEVPDIDNHNDDTSHPSASLSLDSGDFGITAYTSSPWVNGANWTNVANEDTAQDFNYVEDKAIDVANFRHVGNAKVVSNVKDSFNVSSDVNTNIVKVCIDTVVNPSTPTVEYFDEENYRLKNDYTTAWDSTLYCVDGQAIVYGGSCYQGSDLPRILRGVNGAAGTAGSLSSSFPNERVDGVSRQNPNYSGFTKRAVYFRKFLTGNATSYSSVNMNILTNGSLATQLSSGDLKIYIWKLGSVDAASPNIILPPTYNPTNPNLSLANSIWGHTAYNFAAYDDGVAQTATTSGCLVTQTGNLLNLTMGGYNLLNGILVRFDFAKGVRLDEVSVSFV